MEKRTFEITVPFFVDLIDYHEEVDIWDFIRCMGLQNQLIVTEIGFYKSHYYRFAVHTDDQQEDIKKMIKDLGVKNEN